MPLARGGTPDPAANPPAVAVAGRASAARPAIDDSPLDVKDVKVLIVDGRKTQDQDVLLGFGAGQIALTNPRGGAALTALQYRNLSHATYVRARDPKWSETGGATPPKDLDVGSFIRTSKHWLVLQTRDSYLILRLEDRNVQAVLQAVEARTGLAIDRPKSTDDKDQ